jgi:WD40 repeat protein
MKGVPAVLTAQWQVVRLRGDPESQNETEKRITLFDMSNGKYLRRLHMRGAQSVSLSFSADGSSIVTALSDPTIRICNISHGDIESIIPIRTGLKSASFSPAEERIVVVTLNDEVRVISNKKAVNVSNAIENIGLHPVPKTPS